MNRNPLNALAVLAVPVLIAATPLCSLAQSFEEGQFPPGGGQMAQNIGPQGGPGQFGGGQGGFGGGSGQMRQRQGGGNSQQRQQMMMQQLGMTPEQSPATTAAHQAAGADAVYEVAIR
jgi:hypothetical protein